jgi:hypothetical protein
MDMIGCGKHIKHNKRCWRHCTNCSIPGDPQCVAARPAQVTAAAGAVLSGERERLPILTCTRCGFTLAFYPPDELNRIFSL